jgi:hypothetical protein
MPVPGKLSKVAGHDRRKQQCYEPVLDRAAGTLQRHVAKNRPVELASVRNTAEWDQVGECERDAMGKGTCNGGAAAREPTPEDA